VISTLAAVAAWAASIPAKAAIPNVVRFMGSLLQSVSIATGLKKEKSRRRAAGGHRGMRVG
jgi:hypothetical protein